MGYTVEVSNSGHRFTVEQGDTLLEAALRSGINLRYGCSGGSCGECKARIISGELAEVKHHDYALSPQEQADNTVLLCSVVAGSDLVIEADEVHSPRDLPKQKITTKVVRPERIGDVLLFQLRTPRSQRMQFLPGQHIQLSFESGERCDLSIGSCPCNGMLLQFHVRYRAGDPISEFLFKTMRHGDQVEIEGPYGEITLDGDSKRPLLMVAEGAGFAPIKSLIEQAINLDMEQPIRLFWLAEEGGHYLDNLCRSWELALDDFNYQALTVDEGNLAANVEQVVAVMDAPVHDFYCAGSGPMQQQLKRELTAQRQGIDNLWLLNRRGDTR